MEIVFLGSGGGRWNLISQTRRTGGFRINGPLNVHVDPGPGALFASRDFYQDVLGLDVMIVTHNHIDHVNDAGLLIEAMSDYARRKKGWLVGSASVILGDRNGDKAISSYHLGMLERAKVAQPGRNIAIEIRGKEALLIPTRVKHEDKTGFGFVLQMDGKKIGYTSDTEYFKGISEQYAGCDVLIANNLKSEDDGIPGHLHSKVTLKLLSEARPKLAVLTHLGMRLLKSGPEAEAKKIGKASGVRTVSATDGMRINVSSLEIRR